MKYHIKIYRASRMLFSIIVFSVIFPFLFLLPHKFKNIPMSFLIPIFIILVVGFFSYYFIVDDLTITVIENKLHFKWKKKFIMNPKSINSVKIDDIETLVVQGIHLKTIITKKDKIEFNAVSKSTQVDAFKLVEFLENKSNVNISDIWNIWKKKGWIQIAFWITNVVLFIGLGAIVFVLYVKGFNYKIFYLFGGLTTLYVYRTQMKNKL